jgi:23S rRNA (pseudouridine1915-N3)-methyltransferase
MKIILLCVGKTDHPHVADGVEIFAGRLRHYVHFEIKIIPEDKSWKKLDPAARKKAEGQAILNETSNGDRLILLDEKGEQHSSEIFAERLQKIMAAGPKRIVWIVGGANGFSEDVYASIADRISLSKMTFSHQMIRLFFTEQLYRAFTILRNEPYHNR